MRPLRMEDASQATEIDREAFPTPWPPVSYRWELRLNKLTRYFVVCENEEGRPPSETEAGRATKTKQGGLGVLSRVKHSLLGAGGHSGNNQNILGVAGVWFMSEEAHLTTIAAREAYRRMGIGELLLISAIELALFRNAQMLTLEVRKSNMPAQALYKKYGFKEVGVRRGYYTDNREDAIIMTIDGLTSASFQALYQRLKQEHAARWGEACLRLG